MVFLHTCTADKKKNNKHLISVKFICLYLKIYMKSHLPEIGWICFFWCIWFPGDGWDNSSLVGDQQLIFIGSKGEKLGWWIHGFMESFLKFSFFTAIAKTIRYVIPWEGSKKKIKKDTSFLYMFFVLSSAYREMAHLKHLVHNRWYSKQYYIISLR